MQEGFETAGGDTELAIENLRKSGAKAVQKLAGREAKEGRIGYHVSDDGRTGVLVALRCETDPVASNEKFTTFVQELVAAVRNAKPADEAALRQSKTPSGSTVEEGLTELVNYLRENISIGKFAHFEGDAVVQYIHFDNKKAAMVAFTGGSTSDERVLALGKDLCMGIVFRPPRALSRDDLDPAFVAKEREIVLASLQNDPKNAKKPQQILEKIVEGQMAKLYQEVCFLEQPFIKDDKISVTEAVKQSGTGVQVKSFVYIATDI